jgi:hypothetical protein
MVVKKLKWYKWKKWNKFFKPYTGKKCHNIKTQYSNHITNWDVVQLALEMKSMTLFIIKLTFNYKHIGRDGLVSIATRYGLDSLGIKSWWGWDFLHPSTLAPGAHPASCTMGTGALPGVKRPGRGTDYPLRLKNPSGPSWPVLGWTLPFTTNTARGAPQYKKMGGGSPSKNGCM